MIGLEQAFANALVMKGFRPGVCQSNIDIKAALGYVLMIMFLLPCREDLPPGHFSCKVLIPEPSIPESCVDRMEALSL